MVFAHFPMFLPVFPFFFCTFLLDSVAAWLLGAFSAGRPQTGSLVYRPGDSPAPQITGVVPQWTAEKNQEPLYFSVDMYIYTFNIHAHAYIYMYIYVVYRSYLWLWQPSTLAASSSTDTLSTTYQSADQSSSWHVQPQTASKFCLYNSGNQHESLCIYYSICITDRYIYILNIYIY